MLCSAMPGKIPSKVETRLAASEMRDRLVREQLEKERAASNAKTAKLRALRLAKEAAEPPAPPRPRGVKVKPRSPV